MNGASRESSDRIATVPPPAGARDPYSATTRVATLPEDVLEAMRKARAEEADGTPEPAPGPPPAPAPLPRRTPPPIRPIRRTASPPLPLFDAPIAPLRLPSFDDAYAPSLEGAPLRQASTVPELAPLPAQPAPSLLPEPPAPSILPAQPLSPPFPLARSEVLRSIGIVLAFGLLGAVVALVIKVLLP